MRLSQITPHDSDYEYSLPRYFADLLAWVENRDADGQMTSRDLIDEYINHLSGEYWEHLPVGACYELNALLVQHIKREAARS